MKTKVFTRHFKDIKPYWVREKTGERLHFQVKKRENLIITYISDVIITYN